MPTGSASALFGDAGVGGQLAQQAPVDVVQDGLERCSAAARPAPVPTNFCAA